MANQNLIDALTNGNEDTEEIADAGNKILNLVRGKQLQEDAVDDSWRTKPPTKKQVETIVSILENDYGIDRDNVRTALKQYLDSNPDRGQAGDLIETLLERRQQARFRADRDASLVDQLM